MYSAFLQRARASIISIKSHLKTSEGLRSAIYDKTFVCKAQTPCFDLTLLSDAPDRLEWRIIDHCAAVTRLYAIYEQFAHEMGREHLNILQVHFKFGELPELVQT